MIYGIHIEVVLVGSYALLLVGIAIALERLARHSHRRSEHIRHAGFIFKHKSDVWQCPTGHHLTREDTDWELKLARYRAPAHKCNVCHRKRDCTDSDQGRLLETRLDAWVQSGMRRFHRGLSLTLLLLAVLMLGVEMFRYHAGVDRLVLIGLLGPIEFFGFGYVFSFFGRRRLR